MVRNRSRRILQVAAVLGALALVPVVLPADVPLTRQHGDQFLMKVALIGHNGMSRQPVARSTRISEAELNAYLRYHARDQMPAGLADPHIAILGDGRLNGRAIVDLDAVRQQRAASSWLDPMAYLTGRLPISVTGVLRTANGVGRFDLETAEISGVPVPKSVLQELLTYYSRTPENPKGVGLDDPFELPAAIREIRVATGHAVVVQ
jgi:hypothetical protein